VTAQKPKNVSPSQKEAEHLLEELDQFAEEKTSPTQKPAPGETFHLWQNNRPQQDAGRQKELYKKHLTFYLGETSAAVPANLIPAGLAPLVHNPAASSSFPMLLAGDNGTELWSLDILIRKLLDASGLRDEELEVYKRHMAVIQKRLIREHGRVDHFQDFARIVSAIALEEFKRLTNTNGEDHPAVSALEQLSMEVPFNGLLIGYGPETLRHIISQTQAATWRKSVYDTLNRLEELTLSINALVESARSAEKNTDSSQEAFADSIDYDKLNQIVRSVQTGTEVDNTRLKRLRKIAESLNTWHDILSSDKHAAVFLEKFTSTDPAQAHTDKARREIISLIRDYHLAVLEDKHRYDPRKHQKLFDDFSERMMSDEEIRLIPPALLFLDARQAAEHQDALVARLLSGEKIKISVQATSLLEGERLLPLYGWARMATALNRYYVVQTPLPFIREMWEQICGALQYEGAAFFSFYTLIDEEGGHPVPDYLRGNAAAAARIFPLYAFSGQTEKPLRDRFYLSPHIQPEAPWAHGTFPVRSEEESSDRTFFLTPAEFFFLHEGFQRHYYPVGPDEEHDALIPLTDFLAGNDRHKARLPYITMADDHGELHKLLVDEFIVDHCAAIAGDWRVMQEWSGIDNSWAAQAVARLKEELERQAERKIADITRDFEEKLNADREQLTSEIISNLAAGLLSDEMIRLGSGLNAPVATPAPAAPGESAPPKEDSVAPESAPESAGEEEDEGLSFDEAYIDTPLCTSCNECRNINPDMFAYDANKQAYISDINAGTYRQLVMAAENCPVKIIHPGKPVNPDEPDLEDLISRAAPFNS